MEPASSFTIEFEILAVWHDVCMVWEVEIAFQSRVSGS